MKYRNRLSGKESESISEILLAGLWQTQGADPATFIQSADYVIPADTQRGLLPEDLESNTIRIIGKRLGALKGDENSWLGWSDISSLVPNISEQVEMQTLEKFLLSEDSKLKFWSSKSPFLLRSNLIRSGLKLKCKGV